MRADRRKNVIEMALLCSQEPLTVGAIRQIFSSARDDSVEVTAAQIHESIEQLAADWEGRALTLMQTAGGWQFKTREEYRNFAVATLREKPPRLSRALLEVLSVIAYHQPATRGDIERIRGVSVFPNHVRYLEECGWIKPAGVREVPGRPMTYATTQVFLDDLGLASLADLPELDGEMDIGAGAIGDALPLEGEIFKGEGGGADAQAAGDASKDAGKASAPDGGDDGGAESAKTGEEGKQDGNGKADDEAAQGGSAKETRQ